MERALRLIPLLTVLVLLSSAQAQTPKGQFAYYPSISAEVGRFSPTPGQFQPAIFASRSCLTAVSELTGE